MSSHTHRKIRIFVSSTEELAPERREVASVAKTISDAVADRMGYFLEVVDWRTHVFSGMGRPQGQILEQLPVSTWDIFVGILWKRFGTPSGAPGDGARKEFDSGTEEEFVLAYESWKANRRPHVLFFRCDRSSNPNAIDAAQLEKVQRFFSNFSADGEHPGIYQTFDSLDDFREKLRSALTNEFFRLRDSGQLPPLEPGPTPAGASRLGAEGFLTFYTRLANEDRNARKRKVLAAEKTMVRLMAHVGYSYLARQSGRFKDEVVRGLKSGCRFRFLILNPWTKAGYLIAMGEKRETFGSMCVPGERFDWTSTNAVSVIERSAYYRYSFLQIMDEYAVLRAEFHDLIELKLTEYELPATILLGSDSGFFEPYLSVNLTERAQRSLHTFEVEFDNSGAFYQNALAYFDSIWLMSRSLESFLSDQELQKQRMQGPSGE